MKPWTLTAFCLLALALLFLALAGCASILTGTSQPVSFNSTPTGAIVQVGPYTVTTPATLLLKRGSTYQVRFHRDGYVDQVVPLGSSFNGWFLGNFIFGFGGLIGMGIDLATGAYVWIDQDNVTVALERIGS